MPHNWLCEELDEFGPGLRSFIEASSPVRSRLHAICASCGDPFRLPRGPVEMVPCLQAGRTRARQAGAPATAGKAAGSGLARMRRLRSLVSSRPQLVEILLANVRPKAYRLCVPHP
jgi:hypothetical protein